MNAIQDHKGNTSSARIAALAGLAIAGGLAFAVPETDFDVIALFILGPGGLSLWQKLQAAQEQGTETTRNPS